MEKIKVKSVEELLGNENGISSYFIPKYQRGYRWKKRQIEQLLDDVDTFIPSEQDKTKFYCLQPLVIQMKDGKTMVVDGQQRLTTIYIIISCLTNVCGCAPIDLYEIEYEEKNTTWNCLSSIKNSKEVRIDDSDVDCYHITNCYNIVKEWVINRFKGPKKNMDIQKLMNKFVENVKFLWYEIDPNEDAETIFSNINVGKIKLTNSELIKALFLCKENFKYKTADGNFSIEEEKTIVECQKDISSSWDKIENSLQNEEVWSFLTSDSKFNEYDTHIDFIFDVLAKRFIDENPDYYNEQEKNNSEDIYTFLIFSKEMEKETGASSYRYSELLKNIWNKVEDIFSMLMNWFKNREWYHQIGYLLSLKENQNESFIIDTIKCYDSGTKKDFSQKLKKQMYNSIFKNNDSSIKDFISELSYDDSDDKEIISNVLLLFNVITCQVNEQSNPRFPFDKYYSQKWSLEHIHSQTTNLPKDNVERKNWIKGLMDHVSLERFSNVNGLIDSINYFNDTENIPVSPETVSRFNKMFNQIVAILSGLDSEQIYEPNHSICNLTLLDAGTNSSYKNAVFPVKREIIKERCKVESFVPVCTVNVFMKYYSKSISDIYIWNSDDQEAYLNAIVKALNDYFDVEVSDNATN